MPNLNESIFAGKNQTGTCKPSLNGATAIRALFSAAKALLCSPDEPQPQARRRRGETDKGFVVACWIMLRRAAKTGAAARGRFAALQPAPKAQKTVAPAGAKPDARASAALYLSDTLDWLNLWQDNADNDHWIDDEFSAKQDQCFPQL